MTDRAARKANRRNISICCIAWLLLVVVLLSFYIFRAIEFGEKVKTYDKNILVGMEDLEVLNLLGRYSRSVRAFDGYHFVMVYEGRYFLRDDIILTFDPRSRKLVSKQRGKLIHILSVD